MRSIIVRAFDSCYISCSGCYGYPTKGVCSTKELLRFIHNLVEMLNLKKITISGGEPLLRNDIIMLLSELKKMELIVNLDTLGLAFASIPYLPFNAKPIAASELEGLVDVVGIPIDGASTKIIKLFRGSVSIEQMMNVLQNIDKTKLYVCINTVVHKGNLNNIEKIYDKIRSFGCVRKWQLFEFMPIGINAYKNRKQFMLEEGDMIALGSRIRSINDECLDIELKTLQDRKNKYLLVDSDGKMWKPRLTSSKKWEKDDVNNEREILGHINDSGVIEFLKEQFLS